MTADTETQKLKVEHSLLLFRFRLKQDDPLVSSLRQDFSVVLRPCIPCVWKSLCVYSPSAASSGSIVAGEVCWQNWNCHFTAGGWRRSGSFFCSFFARVYVCVCFSLPLFSLPTPPSLCPRHHTPPPPFPFPIWAHFLHLSAALFMLWCRSGLGRGTAKNKAG